MGGTSRFNHPFGEPKNCGNLSLLMGSSLALAVLLGLTSQSKGRAARWRFWSFVFIKVRRLRFAFVGGAPLTSTLGNNKLGEIKMLGMWGNHSSHFLYVIGISTLLIFGVPMAIWPIQWAKTLRWVIPTKTDLAVYYGRCLGCVAFVIGAFGVLAASNPAVQSFYFQFLLTCWVLMVAVHVYGAIKNIQPITETYEIGFWFSLVLITIAFWPNIPA